jgi:hypothetical protein
MRVMKTDTAVDIRLDACLRIVFSTFLRCMSFHTASVIRCVSIQRPGRPLSVVSPRADKLSQRRERSVVPKGDNALAANHTKRKTANAAISPKSDQVFRSAAIALRFLRQPSRPNAPRPEAKRGRAAGSGQYFAREPV